MIKKLLRHIFLMLLFSSPCIKGSAELRTYIIKVDTPSHITSAAGLALYYKGYKVDLNELWAILPEYESPLTFSLIITQEIPNCKSHGNTIRCLKLKDDQKFLWFNLTLSLCDTDKEQKYSWTIEKKNQEEVPSRIPENGIVVLINPDYIDNLVSEPAITNTATIQLPAIKIKSTISNDELHESLIASMMAALDLDTIHTKDRPVYKIRKDNSVISASIK